MESNDSLFLYFFCIFPYRIYIISTTPEMSVSIFRFACLSNIINVLFHFNHTKTADPPIKILPFYFSSTVENGCVSFHREFLSCQVSSTFSLQFSENNRSTTQYSFLLQFQKQKETYPVHIPMLEQYFLPQCCSYNNKEYFRESEGLRK